MLRTTLIGNEISKKKKTVVNDSQLMAVSLVFIININFKRHYKGQKTKYCSCDKKSPQDLPTRQTKAILDVSPQELNINL